MSLVLRRPIAISMFFAALMLLGFLSWQRLPVELLPNLSYPQLTVLTGAEAGLTLGVGMLVDNTVVVIENIYRHRQAGRDGLVAASHGTVEVVQALVAATLVHLAVFLPIFFMQKRIRLFYQDLFYTVSFSLLVSLAVALVLAPTVAARFSQPPRQMLWMTWLKRYHRRLLVPVLRHAALWMVFALALLGCSLLFFPLLGFESDAPLERGEFTMVAQTLPGTVQQITDTLAQRAEKLLLEQPEVKDVTTCVNGNVAILRVRLLSRSQRHFRTREVVERLRPQMTAIPFALVHFSLDGPGRRESKLALEITGPEQQVLINLALRLRRLLQGLPFVRDAVIHLRNPVPEMQIEVIQPAAANLGLTATEIAHGIRSALTRPLANRLRETEQEFDIRTRFPAVAGQDYQLLAHLTVPKWDSRLARSVSVPIWPAIKTRIQPGTTEIHRVDRVRAVELTAELDGLDLFRASLKLQPLLARLSPPAGYAIRFGHHVKELRENRREILLAMIVALFLVYMIMAGLFESFLAPLVILSSVPLATVGVVTILLITGYPVSLAVYIGVLVLLGIVLNNAIVLVDHINNLQAEGLSLLRAILQGAQDRLRPILITSATAVLGLLPMALEHQEGSQLWSPLAWTIIGGLLPATFLTLFLIPANYLLIMRLGRKTCRGSALAAPNAPVSCLNSSPLG